MDRLRKGKKNNAMIIALFLFHLLVWDVLATLYRPSFFRIVSSLQLFPDKANFILIERHWERGSVCAGESWFGLKGKG